MQSVVVGENAIAAPSSDKLDESLVAQAVACVDVGRMREEHQPYTRSYPAIVDPKPNDALDRLGVALASTQLRTVGQTCTPKEIHVLRLSPNETQLDVSVDKDTKANSRIVVANLGSDAQIGYVWYHSYPTCAFSGQFEKIDAGKFRSVRCTSPSQLMLRLVAAFPMPSIDDSDAQRKAAANKQTLVMLVFCHNKIPKPTPIASSSTPSNGQVKRKLTSAAPKPEIKSKADSEDETSKPDDNNHHDDDDDEAEGEAEAEAEANGDVSPQEEWTSAEDVKLAVTRQREKLRTATGKDAAALRTLAVERNKTVEDIITAAAWWVLGRESNLARSLGSFLLSKPYDWFDVVHARLPIRNTGARRLSQAAADANEAILQPYVSNIFTVLLSNAGLVPQWTTHHDKLLAKYRGILKKHKVLEVMGTEPFADGLSDECTVFSFRKAFSFAFCLKLLRYLTPDHLLRMSPPDVLNVVKPRLDEYVKCKAEQQQAKGKARIAAPIDADVNVAPPSAVAVAAVNVDVDVSPKPSSKRKIVDSSDADADDNDHGEEKKKKKKTKTKKTKDKKTKRKKNESESDSVSTDDDNDDDEEEKSKKKKKKTPTKKNKSIPSGGKDKARLAVSKTASKAPVTSSNANANSNVNDDDDDDDNGTMVVSVVPPPAPASASASASASVPPRTKDEYVQLMQTVRNLIKAGDEKQIGEYDWVAAAETMGRVRPRYTKIVSGDSLLHMGPKVLKLKPVHHLKAPLTHVANKGVQQLMSNLLNAECHWDVLKVTNQKLPAFEAKASHLYQFSPGSGMTKDQVYAVELQYHPLVHRLCPVGLFKSQDETSPKAHRLLDSSLFAEVWYIGPIAELEALKFDFGRIPDVAAVIEDV